VGNSAPTASDYHANTLAHRDAGSHRDLEPQPPTRTRTAHHKWKPLQPLSRPLPPRTQLVPASGQLGASSVHPIAAWHRDLATTQAPAESFNWAESAATHQRSEHLRQRRTSRLDHHGDSCPPLQQVGQQRPRPWEIFLLCGVDAGWNDRSHPLSGPAPPKRSSSRSTG